MEGSFCVCRLQRVHQFCGYQITLLRLAWGVGLPFGWREEGITAGLSFFCSWKFHAIVYILFSNGILTLRRIPCLFRNCGKVFCSDCADRDLPLPHQNLFQPVRVCNVCYDSLNRDNEDEETSLGPLEEHGDFNIPKSHLRGRAFSLTSLTTGPCACHCCQLKRPTKFKAVTAGST